jgi:hypothetical protein
MRIGKGSGVNVHDTLQNARPGAVEFQNNQVR